jgi:hypothetical protein
MITNNIELSLTVGMLSEGRVLKAFAAIRAMIRVNELLCANLRRITIDLINQSLKLAYKNLCVAFGCQLQALTDDYPTLTIASSAFCWSSSA